MSIRPTFNFDLAALDREIVLDDAVLLVDGDLLVVEDETLVATVAEVEAEGPEGDLIILSAADVELTAD